MIIGDVLFARIFHNFALKLVAVVIGAVIYYVVIQIVLTLGLNSNDLKLFSALVVAVSWRCPTGRESFPEQAKAIPQKRRRALIGLIGLYKTLSQARSREAAING